MTHAQLTLLTAAIACCLTPAQCDAQAAPINRPDIHRAPRPVLGPPPSSLAVGALGYPPLGLRNWNRPDRPFRRFSRRARPVFYGGYGGGVSYNRIAPRIIASPQPQTVVVQTAPPAPIIPLTIQLGGFCRIETPAKSCELDDKRVVGTDCNCQDKDGPVPGKVFRP